MDEVGWGPLCKASHSCLGPVLRWVIESFTLTALGHFVVALALADLAPQHIRAALRLLRVAALRWTPARWAGFCRTKARATALLPWSAGPGPATKSETARGGTQGPLTFKRASPHHKQPGAGPKNPKRLRPTRSPFT